MENINDNYLNLQNEQNKQETKDNLQINEERKSKIMFNEIIDDLIRKKISRENELKTQIEKNKKNLLEKFYSMSNAPEPINKTININSTKDDNNNKDNNYNNINNQMNIKGTDNNNNGINDKINKNMIIIPNQLVQKEKENKYANNINSNLNNNNIIVNPNNFNNNNNKIVNNQNNMNQNLIPDGQKEYDEIREKYKNERNKKKSSIFKSEDLRISNTNSVHLKKEDFSPINPNMVNQETKNNILIIQKKLFGDTEENEETSKVENIDEIDDLDLDDINIKDFKNEDNSINNKNSGKISNSNINLTNLDTNNINFDLSSNLKSEINDNGDNNYFFQNEILEEQRTVEYFYYGSINKNNNDKYKDFKKKNSRSKNFSVQLVSKLDYYIEDDNKMDHKNKKRKGGSNQEVMNEMNNFINNFIPQNNFNGNGFNYGCFDNINNNININNINNNININDGNLAEIIFQKQLKPKNILKNKDGNNIINSNINNLNNKNSIISKNNYINKNNNNNNSTNINKIQKKMQNDNKSRTQQNYKKVVMSEKPNDIDLNLNQNNDKAKTKIKMNYRHISNSKIPNKNISNVNSTSNSHASNNNRQQKRKNNSVIIKRDSFKEKNDKSKDIYLGENNINNNNSNPQKNFYHFNTNNNFESRLNSNEINSLKNNIKNIINKLPTFYKNPLTTKNKKVSMSKIIKKKINLNNPNNLSNSNGNSSINNHNGINLSNHNSLNVNNEKRSKKNVSNNTNLNANINSSTGNKLSIMNTILKNKLLKYSKLTQQIEAFNKLKQFSYLGLFFIYAEKIKEGFLFKGLYKREFSEENLICNKIFGVANIPMALSFEKILILTENNKKEFVPLKLNGTNLINYTKTILLVKND